MSQFTFKAMRVNSGLSLDEVCERLEISKSTLIKWEKYETFPTADKFVKMCQVYGCSRDDIFVPER